jgi:P63C domain
MNTTTVPAAPEDEPNKMQSLGGKARAKSLTPEERSDIARNAALAKWDKSTTAKKIPRATHTGELDIGGLVIPCAVLDNGERVIADRALAKTLGIRGAGSYWEKKKSSEKGALLPEYVSAKYLQEYIPDQIRVKLMDSVTYKPKNGPTANGISATLLPEICDIWLNAKEKGALNETQLEVAEKAYLLLRAFARVGIIALVDEATGYQDVRDRQALQEILKKYIDGELYKWTETFPISLYKEIFRLKGWAWNNGRMPQCVGHYTNDLVYDRLTKGMLEELKRINPPDRTTGRKKHKNYQFLTPEVGYPALNQRLHTLVGMAMVSETWEQFRNAVDSRFPRMSDTPLLPFSEEV